MLKLLHSSRLMVVYVLRLQKNLFIAFPCLLENGVLDLLMAVLNVIAVDRNSRVITRANTRTQGQAMP